MYKTKYLLIALVAAFSVVLWQSGAFAQEWTEGTVQSYYQPRSWDSYDAGWMISHRVLSPAGNDLGQISNFMFDRSDGHIAFVVLSDIQFATRSGDSQAFARTYAFAPFSSIVGTGDNVFHLSFGDRAIPVSDSYQDPYAAELQMNADTEGFDHIPATIDPLRVEAIYRFYGQAPYWAEGCAPQDLMSYRAAEEMTITGFLFGGSESPALIGSSISSSDNMMTARIEDCVIDANNGRVALLVLNRISGRGDALVAVPFGDLSMSGDAFVLNASGDMLASAPEFVGTDLGNEAMAMDIYTYFGMTPYWTTAP